MAEIRLPYLRDVTPANLFTLLTLIVLLIILITKFFILKEVMVMNPPAGIIP
jgi:hypothetical protein